MHAFVLCRADERTVRLIAVFRLNSRAGRVGARAVLSGFARATCESRPPGFRVGPDFKAHNTLYHSSHSVRTYQINITRCRTDVHKVYARDAFRRIQMSLKMTREPVRHVPPRRTDSKPNNFRRPSSHTTSYDV